MLRKKIVANLPFRISPIKFPIVVQYQSLLLYNHIPNSIWSSYFHRNRLRDHRRLQQIKNLIKLTLLYKTQTILR